MPANVIEYKPNMMNESIPSIELDDPMVAVPIPEQAPAMDGIAELPGTHLGYWDTGGAG